MRFLSQNLTKISLRTIQNIAKTKSRPTYSGLQPGGGGGGHSQYILVGVCRSTSKKGGLRHGHNPKKGRLRHGHNPKGGGVLGTGTSRKMGGLRHGHESKRRGLKNWYCKKDNLSN